MFYGKKEIIDMLDDMKTDYSLIEHEAVFTMEGVDALGLPGRDDVAKNLFLRDKGRKNYCIVMKKGEGKVDLRELGAKLGMKGITFASEKDMADILGLHPGAVSPLGVLNDSERKVRVYIDSTFRGGKVAVHPNDNTASVWLDVGDLMEIIRTHGNIAEYTDL